MKSDECESCGAVRPRWMGAHRTCLVPSIAYSHPYSFFFNPLHPLGADDD